MWRSSNSRVLKPKYATEYKKYPENRLSLAIRDVRDGKLTCYAAGKKYNIPESTIRNRSAQTEPPSHHGAEQILSEKDEKLLLDWLLLWASCGSPKAKAEILETAGEIASLNTNPLKHFKNGTPSSGWYAGFLKRHSDLRPRKRGAIGKASAVQTQEDFKRYFGKIRSNFKSIERLDLLERPDLWWNVDEKVYTRKAVKSAHVIEQGNPKEAITATYAICADGSYTEPMITFKESTSNLFEIRKACESVGADFGIDQTETGLCNTESFYNFVTQHWFPRVLALSPELPKVMTVDGLTGHLNFKLYSWSRDHGVIFIILYPNSTNRMQPNNITLSLPVKSDYGTLYESWKTINRTKHFNKVEFVKLLKAANDTAMTAEKIVNGWQESGLQPFNFKNLKLDDLESESQSTSGSPAKREFVSFEPVSFSLHEIWPDSINIEEIQEVSDNMNIDPLQIATAVHYRDLNRSVGLTLCDLDVEFSMESFGLNNAEQYSDLPNETISNLVAETSKILDQLTVLLKVHEPNKLLNALVIKQQLNIIDPMLFETQQSTLRQDENETSIDTFLKSPPRFRRNPNRSFQEITQITDMDIAAKEEEWEEIEETELIKISKVEREKVIDEVDDSLQKLRKKLKKLKSKKKTGHHLAKNSNISCPQVKVSDRKRKASRLIKSEMKKSRRMQS